MSLHSEIKRKRERGRKEGILVFRKHRIKLRKVLFPKVSSKIAQMEFLNEPDFIFISSNHPCSQAIYSNNGKDKSFSPLWIKKEIFPWAQQTCTCEDLSKILWLEKGNITDFVAREGKDRCFTFLFFLKPHFKPMIAPVCLEELHSLWHNLPFIYTNCSSTNFSACCALHFGFPQLSSSHV